jgi:hypothetical protein
MRKHYDNEAFEWKYRGHLEPPFENREKVKGRVEDTFQYWQKRPKYLISGRELSVEEKPATMKSLESFSSLNPLHLTRKFMVSYGIVPLKGGEQCWSAHLISIKLPATPVILFSVPSFLDGSAMGQSCILMDSAPHHSELWTRSEPWLFTISCYV